MDEDEQYPQSREELLSRFRMALEKPMSERFFDEDDLIEIFDYAGDLGDDFLRMEALMCGARFFPDSHELLERRGIFYSQYSDFARSQFLNHRPADNSMILELLQLRDDAPDLSDSEKASRLEAVASAYDKYSDEDVIQLIETVSDLRMLPWLKSRMPMLRSKAEYLTGLLFESAATADSCHDSEFAAALLEELTEAEPFNSYFWLLLSKQYAQMDELDKALEAIDYSIAIKADSPLAMLQKARYLYTAEEDMSKVENYAKKAIELSLGAIEPVRFLAMAYHNELLDEKACELLETVLNDPKLGRGGILTDIGAEPVASKEFELIPDLVAYGAKNADELLDRFYDCNDDNNPLMWTSWAYQLSYQGRDDLAKLVSDCYERHTGSPLASMFTVEESFSAKRYDETISKITDFLKDTGSMEEDFPSAMAMHVISLVKLGEYDRALGLCSLIEDSIDIKKYSSVTTRLEFIGLKSIIKDLRRFIMSGADPSSFDPFDFWK